MPRWLNGGEVGGPSGSDEWQLLDGGEGAHLGKRDFENKVTRSFLAGDDHIDGGNDLSGGATRPKAATVIQGPSVDERRRIV